MIATQTDSALADERAALLAGDEAPMAARFARDPAQRELILQTLLAQPLDGAVARAFRLIWADPSAHASADGQSLLRRYLLAELAAPPERRACHRAVLTAVLEADALFARPAGLDLALTAARLAVEHGEGPGLRAAGGRLLRRLDLDAHPLTPAMVKAAIQSVDLTLLHGLIQRWLDGPTDPALKPSMDWAMGLILDFEGLNPRLEAHLERRCRLDPSEPQSVLRQMQIGLYHGRGLAALTGPMQALRRDPKDPNLTKVLRFAYWQAKLFGADVLADTWRAELLALDPLWSDTLADPPAPAPQVQDDLAALLRAGVALAGADWQLDGPWQPDSLAQAFDRLAADMATAPLPPGWTPARILSAAQELLQIDRREYSWCSHFHLSPHGSGRPCYGMVKLELIPVLHQGLMALIAALSLRGLDWFLTGGSQTGLAPVARLLDLHSRTTLEIDRPDDAETVIDRLSASGLLPDIVTLARDALALNRGAKDTEAPPSRQGSTLYRFLPHADWSLAEGVDWTPLCQDPALPGTFDVVWGDGRIEVAAHATPPGQVGVARVPGLRLVAEDFVIGPAGTALRPDPYHTSAEFPWPAPHIVAAGRRALRLRPAAWTPHDGPVLVLEGFEALRWRNYYHWMVPMLSRIALARERGLLDNRRLVVPEGLSPWMLQGLSLLGLDADRLLVLPPGHGGVFADALLLSSVEHVSPACIAALRRAVLGPDPAPPAGPPLFLSRKGHGLRALVNQDEVEAMAADLGFAVVAPQELDVAGQVRLFAGARGVAAVEGAALTNTIFAPPDIPVLAMVCQNDMMPIFNDLSIALGHRHRKLAGQPRPVAGKGNRLQPPFHVDPDLARQSLRWVLAVGGAATKDVP